MKSIVEIITDLINLCGVNEAITCRCRVNATLLFVIGTAAVPPIRMLPRDNAPIGADPEDQPLRNKKPRGDVLFLNGK